MGCSYKILFLDVLFPLNVKKIIYVDADQIVRTDLRELAEIDLHGAPYGYVAGDTVQSNYHTCTQYVTLCGSH